jgi:hypothetical protein
MYHARKSTSCQPSKVVADSVMVPAAYISSPTPHQRRCGWRRSNHRAITTPANPSAMTVVTIGTKYTAVRITSPSSRN